VTIPFNPKAIAEEFESTYGRMSAFLGVELPFTNGGNQTTIFYTVQDPPTELISPSTGGSEKIGTMGDGTQIWKITHNGVDTHPIHFHQFNVQLINRVDWAGVVKPPEPNELGWKETVRMNPLEDAIVALRPKIPTNIPFIDKIPNSVRPLDPTMPLGSTIGFKNVDPTGEPVTVVNEMTNFGWEYVWLCHILSLVVMDMMRPIALAVGTPKPVSGLTVAALTNPRRVQVSWVDNSANETGFVVQRATSTAGPWTTLATVAAKTGTGTTATYADSTVARGATYYYRVIARNLIGYARVFAAPAVGYPTITLDAQAVVSGSVTPR
jgi:hypothetical protein